MAERPSAEGETSQRVSGVWVALVLGYLGMGLSLYQPAMYGIFFSDDLTIIVTNPYVQSLSLDNFLAILDPFGPAVGYAMNYSPVHLWAHALQVHFFGDDMYGYHLVNVLLHVAASLLLVMLLRSARLSLPIAASAGAFFLVHPANVEAVAMVFQLKTTLATALSFGALLLFWRHPLASTLVFALAILTKFTAISALPVACAMVWVRSADSARPFSHLGWLAAWFAVLIAVAIPEFAAFSRAGHGIELEPLDQARTMIAIAMRYLLRAVTAYGVAPFQSIAPVTSWSDPWFWTGLVALSLLAWRSGRALIRRDEEAVWWVMAAGAYAPISQIFLFIYPMADRYLYAVLPGLLGGALLAAREPARRAADWLRPRLGTGLHDSPIAQVAGVALMLGLSLFFVPRSRDYSRDFLSGERASASSARSFPDGIQAWLARVAVAEASKDAEGVAEALRKLHELGFYGFRDLGSFLGSTRSDPAVQAILQEMARKTLRRYEAVDDLFPLELYMVAQAHQELGRLPEAVALLEKAVASKGPRTEELRTVLEETRALLEVEQEVAPASSPRAR